MHKCQKRPRKRPPKEQKSPTNAGIPEPRVVVPGELGLDQFYPQPHLPSFIPGKLDAVVAQIDETLPQPETISHEYVGHAWRPQARIVEREVGAAGVDT